MYCKVLIKIYIFALKNILRNEKGYQCFFRRRNFTLDDDAYNRLSGYLEHFRARLTVSESQKAEVMDEIEGRIAELFYKEIGDSGRVVTLPMVEQVA